MKIIYNNRIPLKGFRAINLFGIIFARRDKYGLTCQEMNHEAIHTRQMAELLIVVFYVWYVTEWAVRLIQYRNRYEAYKNICFEREAYAKQPDMKYLQKRRWFGFVKYLKK